MTNKINSSSKEGIERLLDRELMELKEKSAQTIKVYFFWFAGIMVIYILMHNAYKSTQIDNEADLLFKFGKHMSQQLKDYADKKKYDDQKFSELIDLKNYNPDDEFIKQVVKDKQDSLDTIYQFATDAPWKSNMFKYEINLSVKNKERAFYVPESIAIKSDSKGKAIGRRLCSIIEEKARRAEPSSNKRNIGCAYAGDSGVIWFRV